MRCFSLLQTGSSRTGMKWKNRSTTSLRQRFLHTHSLPRHKFLLRELLKLANELELKPQKQVASHTESNSISQSHGHVLISRMQRTVAFSRHSGAHSDMFFRKPDVYARFWAWACWRQGPKAHHPRNNVLLSILSLSRKESVRLSILECKVVSWPGPPSSAYFASFSVERPLHQPAHRVSAAENRIWHQVIPTDSNC
jgi:hypothetical protein